MSAKNKLRKKEGKGSGKTKKSNNEDSQPISNWEKFKKKRSLMKTNSGGSGSGDNNSSSSHHKKRRRPDFHRNNQGVNRFRDKRSGAQRRKSPLPPSTDSAPAAPNDQHLYIACDCEMVGVGPGDRSELARVSLTDWSGKTIYDKFVKPRGKVTNYRTWVSGIRKRDLVNAMPFYAAQKEVIKLLKGKILVGHGLENDLKSLDMEHPDEMIRDTAKYPPLLKRNAATGKRQPRKLKDLAERIGDVIQTGSHSSVEDAVASMRVYQHYKVEWDEWIRTGILPGTVMFEAPSSPDKKAKRRKGFDPFASKNKRRRLAAAAATKDEK
jgi:DNA polymerase III epsilon subunit-like protein